MSEWKPIESAPKDNDCARILLLFASGEVSVAYWDPYWAEGGRGYQGGLAWIEPCSGERLDQHYDVPTHWMPLPAPPSEPAKQT